MNFTPSYFINLVKEDRNTITTSQEKIPTTTNIQKVADFDKVCDNMTNEIKAECDSMIITLDSIIITMIDQMGKINTEFDKVRTGEKLQ